jgi:ABC-2 type transport system permease protein
MASFAAKPVLSIFRFFWLTGPLFDKELRVSSRRRRNYWLRSAYVALLAVFILYMWLSVVGVRNSGTSIYQVSRSSQIGRQAIIAIVWFQFVVSQILAIVMLSSSISDEVRAGTLGVLMTTPINSFQIVTGKLFSRLLQILLLLAMSLPLLAIIRVFGGIQWDYVVSSLCITLTAIIFAGSLSLLLSVYDYYTFSAIIINLLMYLLIFGIVPGLIGWFTLNMGYNHNLVHYTIAYVNPFWAMAATTQQLSTPSITTFRWPVFCMIMLSASALILGISIWRIRYAALGNRTGKHAKLESRKVIKDEKGNEIAHYYEHPGHIRPVTGNPIIWKEKYRGIFGNRKIDRIAALLIYIFCSIVISLSFGSRNIGLSLIGFTMAGMYLVLLLRLSIATAGGIAGEKEARTLPILLVTPLENRDIILGKAKAGILRDMPLFILYFILNFIMFANYGFRGMVKFSQLLYQLPLIVVGTFSMVLFIIGSGSYFGARMKTSTTAIAATIGSFFGIYVFIGIFNPVRLFLMFGGARLNPAYINLISIVSSIVSTVFLGVIGVFLLRRSIRKLRFNVF